MADSEITQMHEASMRFANTLMLLQKLLVENQHLRMELIHAKYLEPLSEDPSWDKR